jgi:hypothetical protein
MLINKKYIYLGIVCILVIASGIYFISRNKDIPENKVPPGQQIPVGNLPARNSNQMAQIPEDPPTTVSEFANLPKELQKKESGVLLVPNKGFLITTSILSNSGEKIVYAEISDHIYWLNDYNGSSSKDKLPWQYTIYVKDIKSDKTNKLFSFPTQTFPISIKNLFIKTANAGGCQVVPFPIAWSNNDKKIILQWGNPTDCGSGGAPEYLTYTIDADSGKLETLGTYGSIFIDNHTYVIYADNSDKSPLDCGYGTGNNYGKLIQKEIETGAVIILNEEPNSLYEPNDFKSESRKLTYTVKKIKRLSDGNCGVFADDGPGEKREITLVKFGN